MNKMTTARAKAYLTWDRDKLVARIAELEARLSRAENVCKAADKAPCRHSNDHTELGCEVCAALAAWREGK